MAADKFKIKIFNGEDPDEQYADVAVKDPMTLYLLSNGKGYFGSVMLFGGGSSVASIASGETSLVNDNGLTILKTNGTINDGDGSNGNPAPSSSKLVTEADLVSYVTSALEEVVTYIVDSGSIEAGGDSMEEGDDND